MYDNIFRFRDVEMNVEVYPEAPRGKPKLVIRITRRGTVLDALDLYKIEDLSMNTPSEVKHHIDKYGGFDTALNKWWVKTVWPAIMPKTQVNGKKK